MKTPKRTTKHVTPPVDAQEASGEVLKSLPSEYAYLSEEQLKLLSTLPDEIIDVFHLSTAKLLRVIEREQAAHGHKLIEIGKAGGKYGVHDPQPYFSVKLGEDGLKVVS
jgi:hypothetical protein